MDEKKPTKIVNKKTWFLGLLGAAGIGFTQGIGIDQILADKMLDAFKRGNITELVVYLVVTFLIWREVRGVKSELHKLNDTVSKSFSEGELRFKSLESSDRDLSHRITLLENKNKHFNEILDKLNRNEGATI